MAFRISVQKNKKNMADPDFEREFLEAHNTYRRKHNAPPLTLSRTLCLSAQSWADHLLTSHRMEHSRSSDKGENLFCIQSSMPMEISGKQPVEKWYNEINDYNFSSPGFSSGTGHFTQVVWKETKELGVGIATNGRTTFVVGQYYPAGNMNDRRYFEKNVIPAEGGGCRAEEPWKGSDNEILGANTKPPTQPTGPAGPSAGTSHFQRDALEAHNVRRRQHGVPPLQLAPDLCHESQKWADYLLPYSNLQHSKTEMGENIWYKWSSNNAPVSGADPVESWYSEIKDYNYSRPRFQNNTGHFTQVVWKDTQEMGIGKATDGKGKVIVVAQYRPAGNITNPGYYEKNVLPPQSKGAGTKQQTSSGQDNQVDSDTSGSRPSTGEMMMDDWFNKFENFGFSRPMFPFKSDLQSCLTACSDPQPAQLENKFVQLPDMELEQFSQSLLRAQNQYRKQHGAEPLTLSPILTKEAQEWAVYLVGLKAPKKSSKPYGQNMWYRWGSSLVTPTGAEVADSWYKESEKFSFSSPSYKMGTGNFSQMVWKSSRKLGVGLATDRNGFFICVAYYNPSGNVTNPGCFRDNISAKVSLE